jgi:endoglucanase
VFTADEFAGGSNTILPTLTRHKIKASFFFTGRFLRNKKFKPMAISIKKQGHYIGPHSDQHLLYCDWKRRDSLLVTYDEFRSDLVRNIQAIESLGVKKSSVKYFLPPYEWYNDSIAAWTDDAGMQLINFTPGTSVTADYTWPALPNYKSSEVILKSIIDAKNNDKKGLNGFILLAHFGTDPRRTDKFYNRLDELLSLLERDGYSFVSLQELLN